MTLEVAALGRPFSLGMLYDGRSDRLIPGITLWKAEALNRVCVKPQENTAFEVLTSDSVSDKWTAMNLDGSLKVSYLFGLVDIGGSAKYLKDTKVYSQSARVTLKYTRSTRFEQLSMDHLSYNSLTFPGVMEKCGATHVVTGIQYGAQAFFIFDQDGAQNQASGNLHSSLHLKTLLKKVPQAAGDLPMSTQEKEEVSKFRCTFYGDVAVETPPSTFEEAVRLYTMLPKLLGANGEKAVPMKVWLYPLSGLDDRAARLVREISDGLAFRAETLVQQTSEAMMQCNELMNHPAAQRFPALHEKIQRFKELCGRFTRDLQKRLSQGLPSVRSGAVHESELEKVLNVTEQTPFGAQRVREFLKRQQQEMDNAWSYVKAFPDVRVVATRSHLEKAVMEQDFEYIVCLNLPSLDGHDSHLFDMEAWLGSKKLDAFTSDSPNPRWSQDEGRARKTRQLLRSFQTFLQANANSKNTQFLISAMNFNEPRVSLLLYEDGDLMSSDWMPPGKPKIPLISGRGHSTMELHLQPSEYGREAIEGYRVEYKVVTAETWTSVDRTYPGEQVTVSGLEANSWYHFRCSAVCKAGVCPLSDISNLEKTLCTSPPGAPHVTATANALNVSWQAPVTTAEGVTVTGYRVEYRKQDTDAWLWTRTADTFPRCFIHGVQPNTAYTIRVVALCADEESLASDETDTSTMTENLAREKTKASTMTENLAREKTKASTMTQSLGSDKTFTMTRSLASDKTEASTMTQSLARKKTKASTMTKNLARENTKASSMTKNLAREKTKASTMTQSLVREKTKASTMTQNLASDETEASERLQADSYIILLVGDSSSGKAALLNGLANYVQGVKWEDDFRFQLPQGPVDPSGQPLVREYLLQPQPGSPVPYSLRLLDAPLFGDQQRPEQDKEVIGAIGGFLADAHHIHRVDAVCPVLRSASTCLTSSQLYVFKSLCSLFGEEASGNLKVLLTSCDAERPPVLAALKAAALPFPLDGRGDPIHYKFNTSALAVPNDNQFHRLLWAAGQEAMREFCASLRPAEDGGLQRVREAMKEREELEGSVRALQDEISDRHKMTCEMKDLQKRLENSRRLMEDNQDYDEGRRPLQGSIVACAQCNNFICHYPCHCATSRSDLQNCSAMTRGGQCQECPGKCPWSLHYIEEVATEGRDDWTKKRAHEAAAQEARELFRSIQRLRGTLRAMVQREQLLLEKCRGISRRLSSALGAGTLLSIEAMEKMIAQCGDLEGLAEVVEGHAPAH